MKKLFFRILPATVVALLVFIYFLPKLIFGKVPIPADALLGLYHPFRDLLFEGYAPGRFPTKNPLITDPVLQTYPWRKLVITNFKEGNWPLWDPYSFTGQPLLANIQSSPFQIVNLLFFIFPFKIAWSLQIFLTPIAVGIFMFYFLKSLKISTFASIFGSVILPFTGFFLVWQQWGTVITAAMWLPLILLSINKIFSKKSFLWFCILVLAISQSIFSGHWQTTFYVLVGSFLYSAYLTYIHRNFRALVINLAGLILGLLICAIQIVPSLEFINLSARNLDQGYLPQRQDWFLPTKHLIQLVAPDFFGNPATYNYWGIWNYAEFVSFIGIIPLGFALIGLFRKNIQKSYFIFIVIFALIAALKNPLSVIPYENHWPLLGSMQPSRIIFLLIFSLVVLAAYGFDYFLNKKTRIFFWPAIILVFGILLLSVYTLFFQESFPLLEFNTARIALRNLIFPLATVFIFLAIVAVNYFITSRSIVLVLVFVFVIFELFRFAYKFSPFSKLSWIFPQTANITFLQDQKKPFRVMTTDRRIFNGNTPSVYNLEAVHGYDPLYLADYGDLVSSWEADKPTKAGSFNRIVVPQKYNSNITNFLNVGYILTFDQISQDGFEKILQEGETKVYKNYNALPRAFFVNKVIKVKDKESELQKIFEADFDIKNSATSSDFEFSSSKINGKVFFKEYHDQYFTLETILDSQAPLILSNIFYPGWQATIDEKKADIKRVNFMFQSIIVPQGVHQVKFKFEPKSFYNGMFISIGGLILTILISIILWRKKFQ